MDDFNPKDCELIDITDEFLAACKELGESELAKNEDFKLSEAMSAIEIMDPKMDTGIVKIERKLETFSPEGLSNASVEEIIAIFDATIALLTSWINAQPMDQTLFTNLCLLKPTQFETHSPHLYTMAISILYLINLYRVYINTASVSNEEDICLAFIRDYMNKHEFTLEQVEQQLKNSLTIINKELKNKRKSTELPKLEALKTRIELLSALFECFNHLLPPYAALSEQQNETGDRFVPDFKKSGITIFKCIQLVRKSRETVQNGFQPPSGDGDADFSWLPVFDPNAYLYLSPPGFPRRPKLHTRLDAYVFLEDLLEVVSRIICEALESVGSTEEISEFLRRFGNDKSTAISRSILQLIIMPNDYIICGTFPLSDIILTSMNRASGLLEGSGIEEILRVLLAVEPAMHRVFDDFIDNLLVRGYIGVFQTFGNNLARQREKMLKTNFDDFGMLMMEATRMETELEMLRFRIVDENNAPAPLIPSVQHIFSNYILHTILDLLHYHFSLGFHLRLFQPYEFTYVYWYFGDIVARSLTNFCDRIYNSMLMEYDKSPIHQQKKLSGKKLQQKTKMDNEFRRNVASVKMRTILYRVEMIISHAMFKFMGGLIAAKQMAIPPREHLRYTKRVEPFQNVPNMLFYTYEEYLRESRINDLIERRPHQESLKEAATYFGQVVTISKDAMLQWSEENEFVTILLAIQKVARKNMIVANLMATQQMTDKKLSFEFSSEVQLNFPLIGFI